MTNHKLLLPSLLASSIAVVFSSCAFADDDAGKDTEVISVVGARIAYANNSTDDNIKSFSSPLSSVNDLINMLPGVSVGEGGVFGSDDWSTTITMRGFALNGSDQQLGMTIDGLPNGGSGYGGGSKANRYLLTEDTARVEVMQGTSDIGSPSLDALGGTFNYISANPNDEKGAVAAVSGGDYDSRKYYLRFDTGRFWNDTTTSYLSLADSRTKRWIGSGSNGDSTDFHAAYKLVSELSWATLTGRISYDDVDETNYNGISLAQFKQNPRWDRLTWNWTGDPVEDQNFAEAWRTLRKNTFAYLRLDTRPSDSTRLEVTPYYHHMKGRGDWLPPYQVLVDDAGKPILDTDGNLQTFTHFDASGAPVLNPADCDDSCTLASSYRHTHYGKDRYGMTSRFSWDITMDNTLTLGLWAERQDRDEYRDWHGVLDPKVGPAYDHTAYWRQYDRTYTTDTLNYYAQDKWVLGDLTLTAGVRKFLVDIDRKDNFVGHKTGSLSSDSDLLPMAGAVWNFAPSWELYGGYSENFKAISDSILETDQDYGKLEAETAKNTDLGLRYFGSSLQVTAAFYHIKFDNRITYIAATAGSGIDYLGELDGQYVNVGGIKSKGFEGSINWQFAPMWSLYSSLTLNDSEYSDRSLVPATDADGNATISDIKGMEVAGAPRRMGVVAVNYSDGSYRGGLEAKYTGDYYGDYFNKDTIESHTVMSLYAGYHLDLATKGIKGLDLTLNVTNLGDTNYLAGGSNGGYYIGVGRTVTANATLAF